MQISLPLERLLWTLVRAATACRRRQMSPVHGERLPAKPGWLAQAPHGGEMRREQPAAGLLTIREELETPFSTTALLFALAKCF